MVDLSHSDKYSQIAVVGDRILLYGSTSQSKDPEVADTCYSASVDPLSLVLGDERAGSCADPALEGRQVLPVFAIDQNLPASTGGPTAVVHLGGAGSTEWRSAFAAPMLLQMLRALPPRARTDLQGSIEVAATGLPRLAAAVSLVQATTPDLRHFLSFNAAERLATASQEEKEALRAQALAWAETHRADVACLAGGTPDLP